MPSRSNPFLMTCLCLLLLTSVAVGQSVIGDPTGGSEPAVYGEHPIHTEKATKLYEAQLEKYDGNADYLVLPGLLADRKSQRIELLGEATGLEEETTVEFLLIGPKSSKGYEAMFWSHARPSDVHRALEFIGMKAGRPYHHGKLQFWPKGERVIATISAGTFETARENEQPVRLEDLIVDKATQEPLPQVGFVFTGSMNVTSAGEPQKEAYAADVMDAQPIVSIFNDPSTVLDIPRRASQREVFGRQLVGPDCMFEKHDLATITLTPEREDGPLRVADFTLDIRPTERSVPAQGSLPYEFLLKDSKGTALTERRQLPNVLAVFGEMVKSKRDPFVSIQFDPRLTLQDVHKLCKFLHLINTEHGIRIEPPADGQLYYEAMLPDQQLLNIDQRLMDSWEVHLQREEADGKERITANLIHRKSTFANNARDVKAMPIDVDTPSALQKKLAEGEAQRKAEGSQSGRPMLLVYAPTNLTYGQLMTYLTPVQEIHNVIHVFLEMQK